MMDLNPFSPEKTQALLDNLIRVGEITSVNAANATARARFEDRDNIESYDLQIITKGSLANKRQHTYEVGENVLCLFLPTGVETGFIIGAYYPSNIERPTDNPAVETADFSDGTRIEYDTESHKLQIDIPEDSGQVVINCAGKCIVNSPKIDLGEAADLEPSVLGDKMAAAMAELIQQINASQVIGNLGAPTSAIQAVKPVNVPNLIDGGNSYSTKNRNQ